MHPFLSVHWLKIGSEKVLVKLEKRKESSLLGAVQAILMAGLVMNFRSQRVTLETKDLQLLHEAPSLMSPPR